MFLLQGDNDEDINLMMDHRFLQNTNDTADDESEEPPERDAEVLRNTFAVYGSIMLLALLLFCYLRRRFPRAFQIRDWVEEHRTHLARDQHGWFSWIWEHNKIAEDEILRECGMDSLCFLRLLIMGYKVAGFCVLHSIWLIPLYRYAPSRGDEGYSEDRIEQLTMGHVPPGSPKLVGTVIAAYFIFLYFMYLIHKEFEWFIEKRHRYLSLPQASNYTVHVRNVPSEIRTNAKLTRYFRKCLTDTAVYESRLRVKAPQLATAVQKRSTLVSKLEHALNYESIKGETPTHREHKLLSRDFQQVESIPTYAQQLREANRDITERITTIEEENNTAELNLSNDSFQSCDVSHFTQDEGSAMEGTSPTAFETNEPTENTTNVDDSLSERKNGNDITDLLGQGAGLLTNTAKSGVGLLSKKAKKGVGLIANTAGTVAKTATAILSSDQDGDYHSAGFVSFNTLRQKNAALQMVHHSTPFTIEVVEAPEPDDIFWANVGRSHKDLQIGNLISLAATTTLCLLWTIPMTFIAGLESAEAIQNEFPFLNFLIKYPFISKILDLIAPLLVKIVNALLPSILERLSMFEGPVSGSVVASSVFTKLAAFMIIQTFFVQAIGGGLIKELGSIFDNPTKAIDLLAESLPSQSTFFIQIVFVGTTISLSLEMLRVVPLAMALIRRYLSPNLTEKEKQTTVFGIRPLADPSEFEMADSLAQIILNFIIMLVYAVIAPLTVFIQGFCFLAMFACYRHQFIYIYPKKPDSGGKMWTNFVRVILVCTLIAEFTLMGFLGIKKSALATPLMIPLIVFTVLFNAYIREQHFRVAEFLPSRDCLKTDERNGELFDLSFLSDAYLQDELREKLVLPENLSSDRAFALELTDQVDQILLEETP